MTKQTKDRCHESHETISSMSSHYDVICINCRAVDRMGSWGKLAEPCPRTEDSK